MSINAAVKLSSGQTMPVVAFGTGTQWFSNDQGVSNANEEATLADSLHAALDAGVTHIDSAEMYKTEVFSGPAFQDYLKKSSKQRSDFFITSKVFVSAGDVEKAVQTTLDHFGTDYLDLYLLHAPFLDKAGVTKSVAEVWKAMEALVDAGKIRSIGVSNFAVQHLESLLATARIPPAVNQIEVHPQLYQPELEEYCRSHEIVVTAYSSLKPLASKDECKDILKTAEDIAKAHDKTTAETLLNWNLSRGLGVVTTSSRPERLAKTLNCLSFTLDQKEIEAIAAAGKGVPHRYYWTEAFAQLE